MGQWGRRGNMKARESLICCWPDFPYASAGELPEGAQFPSYLNKSLRTSGDFNSGNPATCRR